MQLDDQAESMFARQFPQWRQQFAINLLGPQVGCLVRLGKENDRICFFGALVSGCGGMLRRRSDDYSLGHQATYAHKVIALHFALREINFAREVLDQVMTIERSVMEVRGRNVPLCSQYNWKTSVAIAIVAA